LVLAYMSPVITPVPGERSLLLSVCDTSWDDIGRVALEPLRIPMGRTAKETAQRLATAYCELALGVELSGLEAMMDGEGKGQGASDRPAAERAGGAMALDASRVQP
jgi:hypothetical protein